MFSFVLQDPSNHPKRGQTSFWLTPWSNSSKPNGRISMIPFPFVASLIFALYLKRLLKSTKGLSLLQEIYGMWLVFFSRGVFTCLLCTLISPLMWRLFDQSFLLMFKFKERQWIQSCKQNSPTHDFNYSFKVHCCCPAPTTPPFFKPCFSSYFLNTLKHTFVLNKTLFTQTLATTPCLSLGRLSKMVYEHF